MHSDCFADVVAVGSSGVAVVVVFVGCWIRRLLQFLLFGNACVMRGKTVFHYSTKCTHYLHTRKLRINCTENSACLCEVCQLT